LEIPGALALETPLSRLVTVTETCFGVGLIPGAHP
jgi:hypothetical protein